MCSLLALGVVPPATAAEYSLDYNVNSRYEFNDNIGLDSGEEKRDTNSIRVALPATFAMRTDRVSTTIDGEVSSSKYDDSGYNSDDQRLGGDVRYRVERGSIGADASLTRSSTRDTEFEDSGEIGGSATRVERTRFGSSGNYNLDETKSLIGSVTYTEVDYESPRYRDGETVNGYAGLSYRWTQLTSVRLQGYYNRYQNDAVVEVTTDSIGLQAGFNTYFTERVSVSFLGGWVTSDTSYDSPVDVAPRDDTNNTGYLMNGSVVYSGERQKIEGSAVRRLNSSSQGYLTENNEIRAVYRYKISERSSMKIDLLWGNSGALDSRINNDRTFAKAAIGGRYNFSEYWYVTGSYTYRFQDRERSGNDAQSNAVTIGLIYQPERMIWSR